MISRIDTAPDAPPVSPIAAPPPSPEEAFSPNLFTRQPLPGLSPAAAVVSAPMRPAPKHPSQLQQELKRAHDAFLLRNLHVDRALAQISSGAHTTQSFGAKNRDLCAQIEELTQALTTVVSAAQAARGVNPTILPSCLRRYLLVHQNHIAWLLGAGLPLLTEAPCRMQPGRALNAKLGLTYGEFTLFLPADKDLLEQIAAAYAQDAAICQPIAKFYLCIADIAARATELRTANCPLTALHTLAGRWRNDAAQLGARLHEPSPPCISPSAKNWWDV